MNESQLTKLLLRIVVFNTVFMIVVGVCGTLAYQHLESITRPLDPVAHAVHTGVSPGDQWFRSVGGKLHQMGGDFFFGSASGSLASFADNVLTTDIPRVARDVSHLSKAVVNAFRNYDCPTSVSVKCDENGNAWCPGGWQYYCGNPGSTFQCPAQTCIVGQVSDAFSAIDSVASKIGEMSPVSAAQSQDAAFSDGLLRLDWILNWIDAQTNKRAWADTAAACLDLNSKIAQVEWRGCYFSGSQGHCYDGVDFMKHLTNEIHRVCTELKALDE